MQDSLVHVIYLGPGFGVQILRRELPPNWRIVNALAEEGDLERSISSADVLIDASMKTPLDAKLLERALPLRVVATATTGADHIDAACLAKRGIPLLTLQGRTDVLDRLTPAAELSWLLLMACARKIRSAFKHVEAGQWNRECFPGLMLRGRTLGIVGCGRIGKWMARYGAAFGVRVVGCDPAPVYAEGIETMDFYELLKISDFVTLHVPLNESTRGMMGFAEFNLMKDDSILINTSRGAIVDEGALVGALKSGRLAAAGLDVVEGEPHIAGSRLWEYYKLHDNVILTPHIGGFSPDAVREVLSFTARRVAWFLQKGKDL